MQMHRVGWLAGASTLLVLAIAWRGCAGDDAPIVGTVPAPASTAATDGDARAAEMAADQAARAARARHAASMRGAISTLQRYLAALGEDPARADAFWAGGGPPARSEEADLRHLTDLRALRIENRTPVALDSLAPPDAVEIPVELRISTQDGRARHYHGWYRLRRAGDGWLITSAAIDASPPGR